LSRFIPGLAVSALLAALASWICSALRGSLILEPLVAGMLLGILLTALLGTQAPLKPGLDLGSRTLLEAAIVLLGFRLNFAQIAALGPAALLGVVLFVPLIVLAAALLGRLWKLDPRLAVLIGVGSGICGSSAIAAVAPCIGAQEEDSALAISGLSVLGALAVIAFSAAAFSVSLSEPQYGVWAGLSLQAVPNAIAAAHARGLEAGDVGTVVKMARVALLAPLALLLSLIFQSRAGADESPGTRRAIGVPLYVILFIAAATLNSLGWVPASLSSLLARGSALLMLLAMTALGLGVDVRGLRHKAGPAFSLSVVLFLLVAASAYAWARWVV
jgi:uncharacterized integral membrane protein (TIGR00698 family)